MKIIWSSNFRVHKVLLEQTQPWPFVCVLSMAAFPQRQGPWRPWSMLKIFIRYLALYKKSLPIPDWKYNNRFWLEKSTALLLLLYFPEFIEMLKINKIHKEHLIWSFSSMLPLKQGLLIPVSRASFSCFSHNQYWASMSSLESSGNPAVSTYRTLLAVAAATAKSLQSCPTLCDPVDGSPPGSAIPGILQARTLE